MNEKKERFIDVYLESKSMNETIKKLGISSATAYRYLQDAEVKAELRERKIQKLKEVTSIMESKLEDATKELMNIINSDKVQPSIKVQAINSLFSNYQKLVETTDIEVELAEIQEQLKEVAESKNR